MIGSQIAFLSLAMGPPPVDADLVTAQPPVVAVGSAPAPAPPPVVSTSTTAPMAPATPAVSTAPSASAATPATADPLDDAAPPPPNDPLEGFNRVSYAISQPIDRFVLRPVAIVYKTVVPHPLRDGARNFLANLFTPVIFANDMLQLRPKRVLHTLTRFLLNTTLGIGGIFDVAKRHPFHVLAHPNGFGDTLGYYGVHAGPYIYYPVIGPATLRDTVGFMGDYFAQPRLLNRMLAPDKDRPLVRTSFTTGKVSIITMAVGGVDQRAQNDEALRAIKRDSVDPYAALRSSYLQSREGEIAALKAHEGAAPAIPSLDEPLRDPAEATNPPMQVGPPLPR